MRRQLAPGPKTTTGKKPASFSTTPSTTASSPWRSIGERIGTATNAVTLGDLHAADGDLQTDNAPVPPREDQIAAEVRRSSAMVAAAFAVSVLLGVGIGWGLYGNTSSPLDFTCDPGAKPDGVAPWCSPRRRSCTRSAGSTGLLEQTRKRFGDTMGYRLLIYPTYAILDRPDPSDDRRMLAYDYRGGWDDPTNSAKSAADGPAAIDLGKFDITKTVGIMRGAPETLQMKPSDVKTTYLIVEPATDPTTPGALSLRCTSPATTAAATSSSAGDGTIKQVNLPARRRSCRAERCATA